MAETIRAYFKRRTHRALQLCAVGIAVAAIGIALFAVGYLLAGEVIAAIGAVILCSGLWYLERTRCPRCLSRLSAAATSAGLQNPVNFCPYCGTNLDGPHP